MKPPLPAWFDDFVATHGEEAVRAMLDGAVKLPLPALIEEVRLLRYTGTEAELVAATARIKAATTFHQEAIRAVAPPALPRPWLPADTVAQKVRETIPHADVDDDRALLRKALLALTPDPGETVSRWSLVRSALGHGSGVGTAICHALDIDPDEQVVSVLPDWVMELWDDHD